MFPTYTNPKNTALYPKITAMPQRQYRYLYGLLDQRA